MISRSVQSRLQAAMFTRRAGLIAATGLFLSNAFAGFEDEAAAVYSSLFRQFGHGRMDWVIRANRDSVAGSGLPLILTNRLRGFEFSKRPFHRASDFRTIRAHLMSDDEYVETFADSRGCSAAWRLFHSRYPQAEVLVELSGVGFSGNGRDAVVLMSVASGCLGGTWNALFFSRQGPTERWKFKEAQNLGVA